MRNVSIERLEARSLFSAIGAASAVTIIGPTSGSYAAAATPHFSDIATDAQNPNDTSNTNASRDTSIKIQFVRADSGGGIDASNLNRGAVQITNMTTGVVYNGNVPDSDPTSIRQLLRKVSTSGGGDVLVLVPTGLWDANTTYKVQINGSFASNSVKVKDVDGNYFDAYGDSTTTFHTGTYYPQPSSAVSGVSFSQTVETAAGNRPYVAEAIGPDHRFYAATSNGFIYRYTIGSDGTLSGETQITSIRDNNGGGRIITGLAIDPGSTPDNVVVWVSHGQYRFGNAPDGSQGDVEKYADNFTGKISRISGTNLQNYEDIVINIPRSVKDHMNNQLVFDPKGKALYFGVAAMNAMGAADSTWGNRPENIYSATIMQLRLGSGPTGINTYMRASGPVNLLLDGGNNATGADPSTWHYNIFRGTNPLRIYADGIRNAFDMVFAANGHLYAAINGSSAGGNTPATPTDLSTVPTTYRPDKDIYPNGTTYAGPTAPALTGVNQVEPDSLYDITNGAYYGHPDPARGEYILDAGNTGGTATDDYQFGGSTGYSVGQQPDRSYTRPTYTFGNNYSPDGIMQYTSVNGKNSKLDGYLLVARYSSGSDILALKTAANGSITSTEVRIPGFAGLNSPLDIVEDSTTGNLYVSELIGENSQGQIRLLKPDGNTAAGTPSLSKSKASFYVTPGSGRGATNSVTLTNTGSGSITIDVSATKITGTYRKDFGVTNLPSSDVTLAASQSITFNLIGVLQKGQTSTPNGGLAIRVLNTTAGDVYATVNLRAFPATVTTQSYTPSAVAKGLPSPATARLIDPLVSSDDSVL